MKEQGNKRSWKEKRSGKYNRKTKNKKRKRRGQEEVVLEHQMEGVEEKVVLVVVVEEEERGTRRATRSRRKEGEEVRERKKIGKREMGGLCVISRLTTLFFLTAVIQNAFERWPEKLAFQVQ